MKIRMTKSYAMAAKTKQGNLLLHINGHPPEVVELSVGDRIHVSHTLSVEMDEDDAVLIRKVLEKAGYRREKE